jgi:tRNA A-37 threonylcarbamoyl transferase component Bud32/GAF domain-containing protein
MPPQPRIPGALWPVGAAAALGILYLVMDVGLVRPYLWPAGHGFRIAGDSRLVGASDETPIFARPPAIDDHPVGATVIRDVLPGSAAERAGLRQGDVLLRQRNSLTGASVDFGPLLMAEPPTQIAVWREAYWTGARGAVEITIERDGPDAVSRQELRVAREPVWRSQAALVRAWLVRHVGQLAQAIVFIASAAVLLWLRPKELTADLAVLALVLSAVGNGGPLLGSEGALPVLAPLLTVFTWVAAPLAFPSIALAILYFPSRSPLVRRWPAIQALPFLAAAPMIVPSLLTGLFIAGIDSLAAAAVWDARHAGLYWSSFALALALNVAAIGESTWRYRHVLTGSEQRRVRVAMYTVVPGVLAYALKEGTGLVSAAGGARVALPAWIGLPVELLVLLPAFGVTYAVAVHRVLEPRVVLRRSLQYALARRTLALAALVPSVALLLVLVSQRDRPLSEIFSSAPLAYLALIVASVVGLRYRDRARLWLDRRFFRQEYDAQKVLQSLTSRVRFESDPSEMAALVLHEIDAALHPRALAILVGGIEEAVFTPVGVLHGSAESLPAESGLISMARWSDEPLELYLDDPRSPARRLPPDERDWLECTGAVLLVPVFAQDKSLIAVIGLGERRSEEPYTAEDRELLAAIATQVGLGLDIARLRRRMLEARSETTLSAGSDEASQSALLECPACGLCYDIGTAACVADGAPLARAGIPRSIDQKFRIDQRIGRGGMGAVYRARDVRLDRDVALKVVRADLLHDSEARRRFRREAQLLARLQHQSIVWVFDFGTFVDGGAYLVMEFVRGEDLRTVLRREGRLPPARVGRILLNVAGAVDAAHREGILHRDLKPENILLVGGEDAAKVLDFGVAKLIDPAPHAETVSAQSLLTVEGAIVGTPAYMAPEQLRGGALDARADVFSLAVIAYEMLTGELPFGKGSLVDVALRQSRPALPLREAARSPIEVGSSAEAALLAALSVDPARRPSSATDFALSLNRF